MSTAQPCSSAWSPANASVGPTSAFLPDGAPLVAFDPDGEAPSPEQLLMGGVRIAQGPASPCGRAAVQEWNGYVWRDLGQCPLPEVTAMVVHDDDGPGPGGPVVYAGGGQSPFFARWDGQSWQTLPGMTPTMRPLSMVFHDFDGDGPGAPELVAAGWWVGGFNAGITTWNGQSWSGLWTNWPTGTPYALESFDPDGSGPAAPVLIAAGIGGPSPVFGLDGGAYAWGQTGWTRIGRFNGGAVFDLAEFDQDGDGPLPPVLLAAGQFDRADFTDVQHLAVWTGSNWSPLGGSVVVGTIVSRVHVIPASGASPARVVALGNFLQIGTTVAADIAEWDGVSWKALGLGVSTQGNWPTSLATHRDDRNNPDREALFLTASGIVGAGGLPVAGVARWGCQPPPHCLGDLTVSAVPGTPGYGVPDGHVTNDDFFYYLVLFASGDPRADLTTTASLGECHGVPNGVLNNDDFFYYLTLFSVGC